MTNREKKLSGACAVALVVGSSYMLGGGSGTSLSDLRSNISTLEADIAELKVEKMPGDMAIARLHNLNRRGLPSDATRAKNLYWAWLTKQVENSGFTNPKVSPSDGTKRKDVYHELVYTINARGRLDQVTRFLHGFYSSGHVHKIKRMTLTPMEDPKELDLYISVQALSLPSADSKTELFDITKLVGDDASEEDKEFAAKANPLEQESLDTYVSQIVKRAMEEGKDGEDPRTVDAGGLFAAYVKAKPPYVPPPEPEPTPDPPAPPEPAGFDILTQTHVSAIVTDDDGHPEVWLRARTLDKTFRQCVKDTFEIGSATGTIERIGPRDIDFKLEGKVYQVALGKPLRHEDDEPIYEDPPEPEETDDESDGNEETEGAGNEAIDRPTENEDTSDPASSEETPEETPEGTPDQRPPHPTVDVAQDTPASTMDEATADRATAAPDRKDDTDGVASDTTIEKSETMTGEPAAVYVDPAPVDATVGTAEYVVEEATPIEPADTPVDTPQDVADDAVYEDATTERYPQADSPAVERPVIGVSTDDAAN